jgi:hypothetical protein
MAVSICVAQTRDLNPDHNSTSTLIHSNRGGRLFPQICLASPPPSFPYALSDISRAFFIVIPSSSSSSSSLPRRTSPPPLPHLLVSSILSFLSTSLFCFFDTRSQTLCPNTFTLLLHTTVDPPTRNRFSSVPTIQTRPRSTHTRRVISTTSLYLSQHHAFRSFLNRRAPPRSLLARQCTDIHRLQPNGEV